MTPTTPRGTPTNANPNTTPHPRPICPFGYKADSIVAAFTSEAVS